MTISGYWHSLLDLFYPRFCLHCNCNLNDSYERYICDSCKKQISYVVDTHCIRCGASLGPHIESIAREGCTVCKGKHLHFDTVIPITYYDGVMKTLIHKFKYARQRFLSGVLNDIVILQKELKEVVPNIDIIVPVPLYWLKKLQRGFNQSELLSRGIKKCFSKPMSTNNLCRIKNTVSQTHLSKSKRQVNIHDAFFVKYPELFKGRKILLVDDVLTTGVTASECSKKLKEAGAYGVHVLILAIAKYGS